MVFVSRYIPEPDEVELLFVAYERRDVYSSWVPAYLADKDEVGSVSTDLHLAPFPVCNIDKEVITWYVEQQVIDKLQSQIAAVVEFAQAITKGNGACIASVAGSAPVSIAIWGTEGSAWVSERRSNTTRRPVGNDAIGEGAVTEGESDTAVGRRFGECK